MIARATSDVLGYAVRMRGIRVHSHIGVSDTERATAQELVVAVDVELPGAQYPATDELERAADYAVIAHSAHECARERSDRLLETFALRFAGRLLDNWPAAKSVRVAVTKASVPVVPAVDAATVEVVLGRECV